MFNFILAAALSFNFAPQIATVVPDASTAVNIAQEPQEQYIIVYKMNGVVHHVILSHPVNCAAIRQAANYTNGGITILDCGSANQPPYSNQAPPGEEVSEEQALLDFNFDFWPTE